MTTNVDVRQYAYDHAKEVLTEAKVSGYICPFCNSGSGNKGTGMTENPRNPNHYTCWSCGFYGDIIDIIGSMYGANTYPEKLAAVRKEFNLGEPEADEQIKIMPKQKPLPKEPTPEQIAAKEKARQKKAESINRFIVNAFNHLDKDLYHIKRGISNETAKRFKLGYEYVNYYGLALIIPTGNKLQNYTARYVLDNGNVRYAKPTGVPLELFNPKALHNTTDKPIFICEGEIDALSIEEVGGSAIGLGSVSNIKLLTAFLQEFKPATPLLLALDNDERGREATKKLSETLASMSIEHFIFNPYGSHKDANEALIANRQLLQEKVKIFDGIVTVAGMSRAVKKYNHNQTAAFYDIKDFVDDIKESVNTPVIRTGYNLLDDRLDGGLYEGLYVLGAVSSLGKTSFVLQLADQVAADGNDVIIISLEMSKKELMAKSISRHTCKYCLNHKVDMSNAKDLRGITEGKRYQHYTAKEKEIIREAIASYRDYSKNIYIVEGCGDMGVKNIRDIVETHIDLTGKKPTVVVDYLQILAPANDRTSDKQNTDKAILELKRISRDYKLPIIAISSFNRDNYDKPATMSAFKESGGIEYGCDVLMGLNLAGAGKPDFDAEAAYRQNPRLIELKILKNRNGEKGTYVEYRYYPRYNIFIETMPGKKGI